MYNDVQWTISADTAIDRMDPRQLRKLIDFWLGGDNPNDPRISALRYTVRDGYERDLIPEKAIFAAYNGEEQYQDLKNRD